MSFNQQDCAFLQTCVQRCLVAVDNNVSQYRKQYLPLKWQIFIQRAQMNKPPLILLENYTYFWLALDRLYSENKQTNKTHIDYRYENK